MGIFDIASALVLLAALFGYLNLRFLKLPPTIGLMIIALEVFAIQLEFTYLVSGLLIIPTVLVVRFISVSIPISLLRFKREFSKGVIRILTWSGLRGGISVALVLSLPQFEGRNLLLTCTYIVVLFSIIVQGLTLKPLVNRIQSGIK